MKSQIFVNLPVKDLERSVVFFARLGFRHEPRFTDETAACIIISEQVFVMLVTEEKFREFTPKAICDATKATEVLVTITCESREKLDAMVLTAVQAGGTTYSEPQNYGFMYTHGFQDPDGHIWELLCTDSGEEDEEEDLDV